MVRKLILACLLCLLALSSHADQVSKNKGVLSGFHNGILIDNAGGVQFNYQVAFRIWSLLGEPVYEVKFIWSFDERARVAPVWNGEMPSSSLIKELDGEVAQSIVPYEVTVRIDGHLLDEPQRHYWVEWDVGVPGASGTTSYNTPTSPKWTQLFQRERYSSSITEEENKEVFKRGFIADNVRIVSVKWNTSDYLKSMNKKFPAGKTAALTRAAERHIDTLEQLQGLNRDKLDKRLKNALKKLNEGQQKGDTHFMDDLEQLVTKLDAGLPSPMRNGTLEKEYQQALSDIREEYQISLERSQSFWSVKIGTSEYEQWVAAKRAEISARKIASGGDSGWMPFRDDSSGLYGYKDGSGEIILPPAYNQAYSFRQGFALVEFKGSKWFIDETGKKVLGPFYDANSFSESGLAAVQQNNRQWIYIDTEGKKMFGEFAAANSFYEGLASVRYRGDQDSWWYIDINGERVAGPYYTANSFSEGFAAVMTSRNSQWIFIDTNGKKTFGDFYEASSFVNNMARVKRNNNRNANWWFMSKAGEFFGPYDEINNFLDDGVALVRTHEKYANVGWGMIDQKGRIIIPLQHYGINPVTQEDGTKVYEAITKEWFVGGCGARVRHIITVSYDAKGTIIHPEKEKQNRAPELCLHSG